MNTPEIAPVLSALDRFTLETPSWGYSDTGTRFGKFLQDAAAIDVYDKFADAGQVHGVTGCCPTVAVHVLWDFQPDTRPGELAQFASKHGVRIGAINPNLFQDQIYKYGSLCHQDDSVRVQAIQHMRESVELGKALASRYISLWLADGSNYPGQANIRRRKQFLIEALREIADLMSQNQTLLVEYKPFEPAFYHTDLADWGMAYIVAKAVGPKAKVLVDTGHHYAAQNIEQIVAWLLAEEMLGGFHFNDRRYADDDLTLGSIDPYQVFRIFHEIGFYEWETQKQADIAYMIDQSHNDKSKIEATIQTVMTAQELIAKAALVDYETLNRLQTQNQQIDAEELLRDAFSTDVRPAVIEWRKRKNLPENPLRAFRESGYEQRAAKERKQRRKNLGIKATGSYA
jgi:L-rhamnose isomerase / sugar isomerase